MFESSLLQSARQARQHRYATAASFGLQIALAGVLVLVPILYTQALPAIKLIALVNAPMPAGQPQPQARVARPLPAQTEIFNGQLRVPRAIPTQVQIVTEREAPVPSASTGVPGGIPGAAPDRRMSSILESAPPVVPKAVVPKAIQVSQGVATGLLAHKVNPAYPRIAQQAGIQGSVVLQAWIGKEGQIENLRVISGHPLLVQSAVDAVSQWRYKPYLLNGEPVQVETQITVNFVLAGR